MLGLWEDVAPNLACIRQSGNTAPPHFTDEDAEAEEAGLTWLAEGTSNAAIRIPAA